MAAVTAPSQRAPALTFPKIGMLSDEARLVGSHMLVAFVALFIGSLMGPFQSFRRSPAFVAAFPDLKIPVFSYYYQALTVHGVLNALIFTTFFIIGFSYFVTQRTLQRPLRSLAAGWVSFGMMLTGLLLALYAIVSNQANVLYTFYPPMIAHPTFYLGLVLVVVGSWVAAGNVFMTYAAWKRENREKPVPLAVYAIVTNFAVWGLATIPVAVEVLFMLLPLSLGWVQTTDPQMGRVLFWFFGHPLVYFWLIPAYVSWYTMLPIQTRSKLFSDPVARLAFLLFLLLSIPVGVHHLFSDPGVSEVAKGVHAVLTLIVAVPSFLTAFNIGAVLERSARDNKGAKGMSWLWKQDWGNPVVAAQLGGMILFLVGGFTGLIQASLTLNIALHNTAWVPGHFHQTLGGAVTLTYISIAYWMIPMLRGRKLWSRQMAVWQVATWVIGMSIFGHGMGEAGLNGAPRRAEIGAAEYINAWQAFWLNQAAIGGMILLISVILLFVNLLATVTVSKEPITEEAPIQTESDPHAPLWFERWRAWVGVALLLNLFAWGPVIADSFNLKDGFNAPGYRPEIAVPINQNPSQP